VRFLLDLFGGSPLLYAGAGVAALIAAMLLLKVVATLWQAVHGTGRLTRRRVSLVESVRIDRRRRVVLIRRDDIEFTILTGGPQDVILETAPSAAASRPSERAAADRGATPPLMPQDRAGVVGRAATDTPSLAQAKAPLGRLPLGTPAAPRHGVRGPFQRKA